MGLIIHTRPIVKVKNHETRMSLCTLFVLLTGSRHTCLEEEKKLAAELVAAEKKEKARRTEATKKRHTSPPQQKTIGQKKIKVCCFSDNAGLYCGP